MPSSVVALFGLLAGAACGVASAAAPLPLPTGPQLNWQAMEIGAIGHFNMETFQYCVRHRIGRRERRASTTAGDVRADAGGHGWLDCGARVVQCEPRGARRFARLRVQHVSLCDRLPG
jgi:hypothetical protein